MNEDDQDELQQYNGAVDPQALAGADTAPPMPSPRGTAGAVDQEGLKQKLYANLLARLNGGDQFADQRKDAGDENRRNALMAALQQSANAMGSVGGKESHDNSTAQMAGSIAQSNDADLSAAAQAQAGRDKVQDYLLGQIQKNEALKATIAQRAQQHAETMAVQKSIADERNETSRANTQMHTDAMLQGRQIVGALAGSKNDARAQELSDKERDKQDKLYTDASKEAETARGNTAFQQAQVRVGAAKTANDIIRKYPDLNQMPDQMATLLASEIGRIALGGVPGEATIRELQNPTLQSAWAKFASKIQNKPKPAELGAFLQNYKDYIDNVTESAQGIVASHQNAVYNGYVDRFTDTQKGNWAKRHPEWNKYFGGGSDAASGVASQPSALPSPAQPSGGSGTAMAAPMPSPAAVKGPKVGETEDGHVYMGGDPADPKSWKVP